MPLSINKLTAAVASAANEVTVAGTNVNLDFSLVKVEAPPEYLALGQNLSKRRRQDAEHGSTHATAGKLAALFEQILPCTPRLVSAYGLRASDISASPSVNPQGSSTRYGIFADTVGADATSIWAAATSGPAAVPVHLLACMLARHWNASEATSIWVEIVAKRKAEVVTAYENNDGVPFATLSAVRQELTRTQLADWDASARAWLQTADEAYKLSNRQLALIIKNVSLPVDQNMDPYRSVMNAWNSAMTTLENLIKGMPQRIQSAAALLALSAWHIYPDILVLGSSQTEVKMNDKLVETGGVLTIGLTYESPDREEGIRWALSLAHLRYYGPPTISSKSLENDSSRISFDELMLVALGSLVRAWGGSQLEILEIAKLLTVIWEGLTAANKRSSADERSEDIDAAKDGGDTQPEQSGSRQNFAWIGTMAQAASFLIFADGSEQELALRLVKCGFRRGRSFLAPPDRPLEPYFGLCSAQTLRRVLRTAERIELDGHVGQRRQEGCCSDKLSALTKHPLVRPEKPSEASHVFSDKGDEDIVPLTYMINALTPQTIDSQSLQAYFKEYFERTNLQRDTQDKSDNNHPSPLGIESRCLVKPLHALSLAAKVYKLLPGATVAINIISTSLYKALYYGGGLAPLTRTPVDPAFFGAEMTTEKFIFSDIRELMNGMNLQAKSIGTENKTIADILFHEDYLTYTNWTTADTVGLSREQAFSYLAFFDSGNLNLAPSALSNVMAMSSGNSIYVASPLLCDPFQVPAGFEIKRVIGNIGRAGIAMLIPPQNPRLRTPDLASWRVVAHEIFNGQQFDGFAQTSMHLSFSGWDQGLDLQSYGLCDTQVYLLESVVSVHDRGKWVADVDILAALADGRLPGFPSRNTCSLSGTIKHKHLFRGPTLRDCPRTHDPAKAPGSYPSSGKQHVSQKTAIDCWEELLEAPENDCVVRAHSNWLGRLATACVAYQMDRRVVILPDDVCWKCVEQKFGFRHGVVYIA